MSTNSNIIGPSLPQQTEDNEPEDSGVPVSPPSDDDSGDDFGPALPPGFQKASTEPVIIGPALPQNFRKLINDEPEDESEDDDIVGPLPEGQTDKNHLYDASKRIRNKSKEKESARERWMLDPPKVLASTLQTKSVTKFSQKSKNDKKTILTKEQQIELEAIHEKETKMKHFLDKYEKNNKRDTSLLEQHRTEVKNKKPKTEKQERKEFDRDKDLNVPNMDSKRKNTFIKEASSTFGTRFSKGRFEKFL